ncbi:MurR/RpiR family transcriptional regulator [Domibacillus sp. PGB-M46]|uniref:MurR/RpiR family transcriptional regulator n=1 Tax=Domibacillus sp. PGB-M46 TaxID=2910255 RepID=UPI001F592A91|nr:MurR/RpiR family transcriptional regulator [Domibacillus sp. PGB-M46]MCI2253678.1 MurR/RpiR family transcriptional regulator [Domibacillus sp. PGB-M46]
MSGTSMLEKIKLQSSEMSTAEQKVASFILSNAHLVPSMTTGELSKRAEVSEATVIRFCKTIGVGSYKTFKLTLVKELSNTSMSVNDFSLLQSKDSPYELFNKVTHVNRGALDAALSALDKRELSKAVQALLQSKMILFYGVGGSAAAAVDGHYKFAKLGFHAVMTPDFHFSLSVAAHMQEGDVFIAISTSGKTKDVIELARFAQSRGATVIAITAVGKSVLYKEADIILGTPMVEHEKRIGSIASRTVQMNMIDALYVAVFHQIGSYVEEPYAKASDAVSKLKK